MGILNFVMLRLGMVVGKKSSRIFMLDLKKVILAQLLERVGLAKQLLYLCYKTYIPVSYTHLDVYKRQRLGRENERLWKEGNELLLAMVADFKGSDVAVTLVQDKDVYKRQALGSNPNAIPEINIRGNSSLPMSVDELNNQASHQLNAPLVIMDGFEISLTKLMDFNDRCV